MKKRNIKQILISELSLQKVYLNSEDNNHFHLIAIGNIFNNLNSLEKEQIIYKVLMDYIINGDIHAISIKTFTPNEWLENANLYKKTIKKNIE
ncbi:BolA family protein [Candidatus Tachikawaea gelatinosa]|uniref:Predicted transcriptional regulator-BolA superfamily n=1 Tax=Candidatus Tachikawaea gelatinosa TaxID=1410383 RepID=A0A090BWI9_9ENTR|nr:BolA/IbaG family iron-sulfur metabolism protein [Candidatus Tachikawaea gelatinosa]BAP58686.1 predicted transcriptional regulator- BolA superfamily [Candidatus Tachikawaea gelatinosa]